MIANYSRMKAAMDECFRFKVGDAVGERSTLLAYQNEAAVFEAFPPGRFEAGSGRSVPPAPMIIVERLVQECHGGIQLHYLVRRFTREGAEVMVRFTEIELVAYADFGPIVSALNAARMVNP